MRLLETEFVSNCDKMGDNKFVQVKRNDNVAIYHRKDMNESDIGYEVFEIRKVFAGSPLPGGNIVQESYEGYPGAKSFGKNAYFTLTLERANVLFDEINQKISEKLMDDYKPKRGRKKATKPSVQVPDGEFSVKMLMTQTGMTQPQLQPILKQWLNDAVVVVKRKIKSEGRGRPSFVYERA